MTNEDGDTRPQKKKTEIIIVVTLLVLAGACWLVFKNMDPNGELAKFIYQDF